MRHHNLLGLIILVGSTLVATVLTGQVKSIQAQSSNEFTYQGWLLNGSDNVSGTCSFDFSLFDTPSGGNQLGTTVSKTDIAVTQGYFSVSLDFGPVFTSTGLRFLEIHNVNCGFPGDPVDLSGRVTINPAVYANYAITADTADSVDWSNITNKPAAFADDSDDGVFMTCANNQTLHWAGGGWACTNVLNDHGALTGLSNDDHVQYLLVSGARAMSGPLNLGGKRIVNLPVATASGQPVSYEQAVKVGDAVGGNLVGSYGAVITVTSIQGRPITNTVPITNQVFTWDGGQWSPADPQAGGPAGGDLSGTYPNPTVDGLQGRAISPVDPLDKQVLRWNSFTNRWEPADVVSVNDVAAGDLAGTYPDPTVDGIQGRAVSSSQPGDNQVLTWNSVGSRWEAADPQTVGTAGGDLSGSYPNPTVVRLQGKYVSSSSPTNRQVFTWNGSSWGPADITHLQGKPVAQTPDPTTDQLLTWHGTQWEPSAITTLQGRPVADAAPQAGQVLVWDGSQWSATTVLKAGDAAGGDLNGTYPNPQLNPDTVGMAQLNIPMGYGTGTGQFNAGTTSADLFIIPSAAGFVPIATGKCLVTASAYVKNTAGGDADDDPTIYLRTAKQVGTGTPAHDGSDVIWFGPDDVSKFKSNQASAGFVWPIDPADLNQAVKFGCYIIDPPGDWDGDESAFCRVSYLCQ